MSWHPRTCCYEGCRRGAVPDHRHPLCRDHAMDVARAYYLAVHLEQEPVRAEQEARAAETRRLLEARRLGYEHGTGSKEAVVYYLRMGDHIKIGFTTALRQRIRTLRAHPTDLLALETGGRDLENERHRQFKAARIDRRENFRPTPELLAHIDELNASGPLPLWSREEPKTRHAGPPVTITRRVG